MTNGNDARTEHPDELLAGYVDGSASPAERRIIEAHLAGCSQCRDELALATRARTALMSLPELEAPGLAARGIEGLLPAEAPGGTDELAGRRQARREAHGFRRWQSSWAALAGVAAVLALLAIVPLVLIRGGGSKSTTAGGPARSAVGAAEAAKYPRVFDRRANYDQASLRALASQLGNDARSGLLTGSATKSSPPPSLAGGDTPQFAAIAPVDVVRCALRGTGLPSDTTPVYLERATYQGKPAFVVAVQTQGGSRSHLRVYAVSQKDCTFLFEADQPL
jgi:putative zinc finger protein